MSWFGGKSLIVPVDYTSASLTALKFCENVAKDVAGVHAIHVVVPMIDANLPYAGGGDLLLGERFLQDTADALERWLSESQTAGLTSNVVRLGDPGLTIADYAGEHENPVVVIPSNGRVGLDRVVMGSVAERVVRHAHCPVFVLKEPLHETNESTRAIAPPVPLPPSPLSPSPIVVPFDFSSQSEAALEQAMQFAHEESDLHIVHVLPQVGSVAHGRSRESIREEKHLENATESLRKAIQSKAPGANLKIAVGDPGHVIADFAKSISAKIIILSSHGRTGLARVFLGSVAERVVRFAVNPVLVLKSEAAREQRLAEARAATKEPNIMDKDELLSVYSTSDSNYAEVLRNALHAEGIKCEIEGEHQGGFAGLNSIAIQLLVRAEDYDKARKYIQTHHPK